MVEIEKRYNLDVLDPTSFKRRLFTTAEPILTNNAPHNLHRKNMCQFLVLFIDFSFVNMELINYSNAAIPF